MDFSLSTFEWIIGAVLIFSALGILLAKKPVHACLSFLLTLLALASLYLQLSAEFIAMMQILVYAGAILVIFMIVMVLFQDAHHQLAKFKAQSNPPLIIAAGIGLPITFFFLGKYIYHIGTQRYSIPGQHLPTDFGTVQSLGQALYIDFFFPFEAIILLFLVAIIGSLYVAKKVIT